MPHVIYATLALALLGLATLNQQRSGQHEQSRAIRIQVETAAMTVGTEILEGLAALPFDSVPTTDTTALTPQALFGPTLPGQGLEEARDVDDADGVVATLIRTQTDPVTGDRLPVTFSARVRVRYVRLVGTSLISANGARTLTKEAEVTITTDAMDAPARFSRTYSPRP